MATGTAPTMNQPPKQVMNQFLEFMGDIIDVQQKLTDSEYKRLTDSANALYQACIAYRQEKANAHTETMSKVAALSDMTIDALVCKVVRDEPWDGLTLNVLKRRVLSHLPHCLSASMIDTTKLKHVMDREVKALVAAGRSDPAAPTKKRKRA